MLVRQKRHFYQNIGGKLDTIGMILGVFGPLLAAVGALLLARDIMRGPALWYWKIDSPIRGKRIREEIHLSII